MDKIKSIFIGIAITTLLAIGVSSSAYAADTLHDVTLNEYNTNIPIQQVIHAGASADLTNIKYTITIAPQDYSPKPTEDGVYIYGGDTVSNSPIIINADNSATGMTTGATYNSDDASRTWDYTRSLADLFGTINDTNFPQAGLYEFTITEEVEGGSSDNESKWTHIRPTYLLQVLVKNTVDEYGKVNGRAYAGWTLSKWNGTTYEKVNSGAQGQDGKAKFESDYVGKTTLNVTKQVSGDYASTTHQFPQEITLYLPDWAADATLGIEGGHDGDWTTGTDTSGQTRVYSVKLAHGETVTFSNIPVGTRYQVDEKGLTDGAGLSYDPRIDWSVASAEPAAAALSSYTAAEAKAAVASGNAKQIAALQASYYGGAEVDLSELVGTTFTLPGTTIEAVVVDTETYYTSETSDADNQKAMLTWQTVELLEQRSMNPSPPGGGGISAGGWDESDMRTYLNGFGTYTSNDSYINTLDDSLVNLLVRVNIIAADNGGSMNTTTSSDYLFLPAETEIFGKTWKANDIAESSLSQWDYYANSTQNERIKRRADGMAIGWWLRSPHGASSACFCFVGNNGAAYQNGTGSANVTYGIAPCGCF